jgi:sugar transferase (PEP-CTERM/EpsH1 system associated)
MCRAFNNLPASVSYYDSPSMHKAVRGAIQRGKYDLIFVYCSSMAQYVPLPAVAPMVIDFVDADSAKWMQYAKWSAFPKSWLYAREGRSLARYEKQVTEDFDHSIVTTPQEALDLGGGQCRAVEIIANGVAAPPTINASQLSKEIRQWQPYVLFVGTMNYRPNTDAVEYFAKTIFPLLRQSHPELRFLIVGRDPSAGVKKLGSLPGVIVTGSVPEVHSYLTGAAVTVAPFRIAQGVQNKVLEALVAGVPIVLTSRPARAIDSAAAHLLLVADTPEDFAGLVRSVVENPKLRQRSQEAAQELKQLLAWRTSLARLEELLESAAGVPRGGGLGVPSHVETH